MKKILTLGALILTHSLIQSFTIAQSRPATEGDYYRIVTLPIPEDVKLEVGGLAPMPDGRLAACTRRGEVWIVGNPYMQGSRVPTFTRFASGLHEPLGLMWHPKGYLLCTQRGEVTKLIDNDGDDVADEYRSFYKWPLSGNYHEYSYGPVMLPDGNMVITLNLDWIGFGASLAKWRGWMLKLNDNGEMTPWATGLRSPAGFGVLRDGSIFYTENQGDWVGSGRMTHLEQGDFAGNPAGLRWTSEAGSPLTLKPEDVPSTGKPMHEVAKTVKNLKVPAVWFPHTLMGISTSDIKEDTTNGAFGPFSGQLFVGDQGHSKLMRVALEKVNGEWQGACFPFREGFQSGILRTVWGQDGSLFVGMTNRGWASTGKDPYGIQRLVWTGKTPFEMKTIRSKPDGFEVTFTLPVDRKTAENPDSYGLNSFTYKYHKTYGSPIEDARPVPIRGVIVAADGLSARIVADTTLREGYIHELKAEGIRSASGLSLLHNTGYYTLNAIAPGEKANVPARVVASAAPAHNHADMVARPELASASTKPAPTTGKGKTTATKGSPAAKATAKRVTDQPADWTNGPDQTLTIGTKPGLKFDTEKFEVKAGSRVKLVFNNNDDMLHNCVIVKPGAANAVGNAALRLNLNGPKMQYVPNSPDVLHHTNILQPETAESIYFVAPTEPGDYQFVCTFPGHSSLMQGTLKVVK
ncbi:plastocyanin/azurin family copper-binding protein [Spirosoma montaniterrae]|uniref:Large, multifunctional secreted protein n=1 Tax=Spirosoma montaniterrae TaxID=1178516 RepID=A0A1P9X4P3_9BACT|nr:plastocyanin/azurin family copper-binding protein [Spirosoma montaniterrae]AQG82568.1 large, multifunctional secreted protein [Spirosoma montaniterrae]